MLPGLARFRKIAHTGDMKTVENLLKEASTQLLRVNSDLSQAWLEAELLLSFQLNKERTWLVTHGKDPVLPGTHRAFLKRLARRTSHEPLAHIFGEASFYGRTFQVTADTLIPRFETELLVEAVKKEIGPHVADTLAWDAGTGSGVIAISLQAIFPDLTMIASDISPAALRVAKRNARRLAVTSPRFLTADLFDQTMERFFTCSQTAQFIIVANLPYLPLSDKNVLDLQVTKYEPANALFTTQAGRYLNEKLLKQLSRFYKKDRRPLQAFLEFDPPQEAALLLFAKKYFPIVHILKDTCGRARVLVAKAG